MSVSDADRVRALRRQLRPRPSASLDPARGGSGDGSIGIEPHPARPTTAGRIVDLENQVQALRSQVAALESQVAEMESQRNTN